MMKESFLLMKGLFNISLKTIPVFLFIPFMLKCNQKVSATVFHEWLAHLETDARYYHFR
jgi:hypothetical protein